MSEKEGWGREREREKELGYSEHEKRNERKAGWLRPPLPSPEKVAWSSIFPSNGL